MSIFNKKANKEPEENNELENILIEMTSQLKELREDVNRLQGLEERISELEEKYTELNQKILDQYDTLTENIDRISGRRFHSGIREQENDNVFNSLDYEQMRARLRNKK